ncbi:MAG: hypothetical protein CMP10_02515 [Zetaproteobacteria bacterium]|nr:hypothetical protein [Pseudobdellovibrionaceae bacterium]
MLRQVSVLAKLGCLLFWAAFFYNIWIPFQPPVDQLTYLIGLVVAVIHMGEAAFMYIRFGVRMRSSLSDGLQVLLFGAFYLVKVYERERKRSAL